MKDLNHKHILKYYGHIRMNDSIYIYLEYMSGGTIASILKQYGALEEETLKCYAK